MKDGMNYAPTGKPDPVCKSGEFLVGVIGLDHGHINGMCNGLVEAGAVVRLVYDDDAQRATAFAERYPGARVATSMEQVFEDPSIHLIASAAIPSIRGSIGERALASGKDFFSDKPPFTTLEQVASARQAVKQTGRTWFVYYSEHVHNESAIFADQLIEAGAIGKVVAVRGWGPHRLDAGRRAPWFFDRQQYGGILTDIASHQVEQLLHYSRAKTATLVSSRVGNLAHPQYPGLDDYGDASFTTDTGVAGFFSVDWFTPDGLGVWGDGRMVIIGTDGYIELRKYINVATAAVGNNVFLVDGKEERHYTVSGTVGFPFFGRLIRDVLDRTETAMDQELAFVAIELAIEAQTKAQRL